jgi:hypothetical protein
MADENRGGEIQISREQDDTVFLNGNRNDAPRYILVCPTWNGIFLVFGCNLGIYSGALFLAFEKPADLSRYLLFTLGIGTPAILAFLVKLRGRRLHLRGEDNTDVSGEIRESADEYITVCPMTLFNQILLVPASCLLISSKAVVISSNIQSFFERFLVILGIGMLMTITSIRVKRHWHSPPTKRILSLMKIVAVGVLARAIMPALPDRIAGGMRYFVVMEIAGPKTKRKVLWTIYLCLHVLSFICPEEIIFPRNIFFYGQMGLFELLVRCLGEYAEEGGILASVREFLDSLGMVLILLPILGCMLCRVPRMRIFQQMGVDVPLKALVEKLVMFLQ